MLSAPSTPNIDSPRRSNGSHIEELALAELKIHLEKRIQDKEYKIQDLEEELNTVKESLAEVQKVRDENTELQETKTRLEYEITQKDLEARSALPFDRIWSKWCVDGSWRPIKRRWRV